MDQLDQALESKVKDVEKYFAIREFKYTEQTTMEELATVLKEDEEIAKKTENDGPGLYRYVRVFDCLIAHAEAIRDSSMKRRLTNDERRRSNSEECKMI